MLFAMSWEGWFWALVIIWVLGTAAGMIFKGLAAGAKMGLFGK